MASDIARTKEDTQDTPWVSDPHCDLPLINGLLGTTMRDVAGTGNRTTPVGSPYGCPIAPMDGRREAGRPSDGAATCLARW